MKDCPLIGILVPNKKTRKSVLQLYERYHNLPLKLYVFTPADILWKSKKIIGLHMTGHNCQERTFPFPHAVYNRCYNKKTKTIQRLNKIIGGDQCFNSINWLNKWKVHKLLNKSHLKGYLPDTFLYNEVNLSKLLRIYKQLYIKPSYGNQGRSVYRLEPTEDGDVHISMHSLAPRLISRKNEDIDQKLSKLLGKQSFIVQKGIQSIQIDHQDYDIRVLVQKNINGEWSVSTMACRMANELYFNTSVYSSIFDFEEIDVVFPMDMKKNALQSIKQISIDAAAELEKHLGLLGELSVDFVIDQDTKLWIIEVNGKPQKNIYKDIKNFQHKQLIYSRPIEYAYYLSTLLLGEEQ